MKILFSTSTNNVMHFKKEGIHPLFYCIIELLQGNKRMIKDGFVWN